MSAKKPISPGTVFTRWTVLREGEPYHSPSGQKGPTCVCRCTCGTERTIRNGQLLTGHSKSCGCLRLEFVHGHTRGNQSSKTFKAWQDMIGRCTNSNHDCYLDYGGRGITVCQRWLDSFVDFLADMGESPEGLSLDRIDNNSGYRPDNCRWTTPTRQMRNMRRNQILTVRGETACLAELCERFGVSWFRTYSRIFLSGWDVERAFFAPKMTPQKAGYSRFSK